VGRQALLGKEIHMHDETAAFNAKVESFRKEQNAWHFDLLAKVSGFVSTLEGMPRATLQEFANQDGDQLAVLNELLSSLKEFAEGEDAERSTAMEPVADLRRRFTSLAAMAARNR
jgi:hypothetical protein